MKLANRAYLIALILLTLAFAVSAQTTNTNSTARPEKDPRNTAPSVGTGGTPGGPTGLFTIYDGQTLRRGEFTFSAAYSNYDRDPGNADITEVPVSFQIGLTNNVELFFNTDAYRGIKVNSPRSLSSFYLPNSQASTPFGGFTSRGAIVLSPTTTGPFAGTAVFRPAGTQGFVQYPFIGGTGFGFPQGAPVALGTPSAGGGGAANFPGIGSVYGSILPGIVLQTATTTATGFPNATTPTAFTTAPSYLPDAPFINRNYGTSSFSTFSVGAKIRLTGVNNPVGFGVIPFYRFYADKATDFSGFNQMQRGASPGSNRGDFGAVVFADARLRKWVNVSGNVGFIYNGDVKADLPSGSFVILDRPDEFSAGVGVDFPVNKYFQPILETKYIRYTGGRTPNAFENNPVDALAGIRIFPARYFGMSFAYRYHANQQDADSFKGDTFTSAASVNGTTITNTFTGLPPGFLASSDPHGFIVQVFAGRRDKRATDIVNLPANVTAVTLAQNTVVLPCPAGTIPAEGTTCGDNQTVGVSTTAVDPESDVLTYNYTVSGGRVTGQGANVSWDLTGVRAGTYTITAGVDDGCGVCGQTKTQTITVSECPNCTSPCSCPTISVSGPAGVMNPGASMTFTANVSGGSQNSATYNWSVSSGEIVSGQGTPSITVTAPADAGNVTATVDVGGLCATCPTTASETAGVAAPLGNTLVDEFGAIQNDDVKARLDPFFIQLGNDPNASGYIINYGTPKEIAARLKVINAAIKFRNYPADRVTFVDGGDKGTGVDTKLYLVPAGATPPTP